MALQSNQPLPAGYRLQEYTIDKVLSSGGFSIVYLAHDEVGTPYAIKEYLPAALVARSGGADVSINSGENQAVFRHGLKCFFEEGRSLALISHPNIVRVENFFRANETVYMVMQYVRGRTLQFHIQRHRYEFSEAFIRRLFTHLLNGLREVHANKLLHLDIKPANIYITMEGKPVLLDFGAARQALTKDAPKLRAMYTAGFAAPEQYHHQENMGPWTDIYAIGATIYACIGGIHPQPASERLEDDRIDPLHELARRAFSEDLYGIIDWCLQLDHLARPQSAFELQRALMKDSTQWRADVVAGSADATFTNRLKATLNKKLF
ncbi:MAG: serine/threonine protein kinase [Rhodocyclaceae bacterium]|jgi:serine/threonine protein kinase|nr:serine/threonine protein kinase [Rhodocyclaceae bacterium]MCA3020045.1 serine/threonine protein kinase [Rhodocyclaceae bacterium]MCA3023635.1 serine/threonine protein kinase [Rhodocyclaceae bacterium]MCA3026762.1 serine/threonine protein kinase [Rhodocyclaceae bacterium]MCA3030002.1 serine/threonine protein kinase [Rhodocyclaceae bacterium]